MATISVTRLHLRSFRFFPSFIWHALRSRAQASSAPGNRGVAVRNVGLAFWTLSLWDNPSAARAFVNAGPHKKVMPRLMHWCDEASVVNWEENLDALPSWEAAERRLANEGRLSRVRFPSPAQAAGNTLGRHQ